MSGSNVICSNGKTAAKQRLPFYITVAGDTWIWGTSCHIFCRKIIHNLFTELIFKIHNIIRDTNVHGNTAGIIYGT